MNEKLKSLIKVTGISPDTVRYNKKAIANLINGDSPGPGPQPPTPSENTIIFSGSSLAITFDANGETVTVTITSTINGFYIPFTIEAPNWITPTNNNGILSLVAPKNDTGEDRSGSIVLTQGELDGEQKTITIEVSQEAAVAPTFDFISNIHYMLFGASDTVMLDYFFTDAPNAEKKNITGGGSPSYILDPKCLKNYNAFGNHTSQYKGSGIKNAVLLGFTKSPLIPSNAFGNNPDLQDVLIPDTCLEIKNDAFKYSGSTNGLRLYFLSSTPPTFAERALLNSTINKIYVPIGAKTAYDAVLPDYTQYIEEANIKIAGGWSANNSYKYNETLDYNEAVQYNLTFDEIMAYINT